MIFRGVLALLVGVVFTTVACGCRGVDVWVWDWADVVVRQRTRYGTPWRSLTVMRVYFGVLGAVSLVAGLYFLAN
ncbi:hypothetical protein [Streptomyces siamensis]|uniref:Lipoprotein n=1 Tax=Streptomyces siamensis TaxID=1274986 RepID=A0ABP9J1Y2_9ACTN